MGAYHTLDLELQRNFTISKQVWDTVVLDRLEEACDPVKQAEVAAVVMQPGLANVCLLTSAMTITRQRIDVRASACRNGHGRWLAANTAHKILRLPTPHPHPPKKTKQMPIPKKRAGNVAHDKALQKFYRATYEAVVRHINFGQVRCFWNSAWGGGLPILGRLGDGWRDRWITSWNACTYTGQGHPPGEPRLRQLGLLRLHEQRGAGRFLGLKH